MMVSLDPEIKEAAMARWKGEISQMVESYLRQALELPEPEPEAPDREERKLYHEVVEKLEELRKAKDELEDYRKKQRDSGKNQSRGLLRW